MNKEEKQKLLEEVMPTLTSLGKSDHGLAKVFLAGDGPDSKRAHEFFVGMKRLNDLTMDEQAEWLKKRRRQRGVCLESIKFKEKHLPYVFDHRGVEIESFRDLSINIPCWMKCWNL